ncbi:AsmA family protein [Trinickia violacea]|uniref:AsmA family protein n=1 Tax=Trinickia violacea TaxID=2571746 RepID=A0A4P8IMG2_9BURK|nr:AsmA family protein [Trinickia violacea]QCP49516.1 AsmA family protein [Trinickia violacea]
MSSENKEDGTSAAIVPRSVARILGKIVAWLLAIAAVLVAATVVFALTFDWNRARPWIDDKVTQAIGRPFAINGDLRIGWQRPASETGWRGWVPWPRFTAQNITVGNPDWAKSPHFATLDQIGFEVEVLPLLAHAIVIPSIDLVNPSIDVERLADGRNNWTFKLASSGGPSTWTLQLRNLAFAKGSVAVSDAQSQVDMQIGIDTLGQAVPLGDVLKEQEASSRTASAQAVGQRGAQQLAAQASAVAAAQAASSASEATAGSGAIAPVASGAAANAKPALTYALGWTAKGAYEGTAISGSGKLGSVLALQGGDRPFPLQAEVRIGDTHLALVGTLTDPSHLAALDLRLWLAGVSLSHLYAITGITLPQTPPYATDGRLIGGFKAGGNEFTYENFTGRVGGSDINGTITYTGREPRPMLSGELVSNVLQFSDLAPIIGADTRSSKAERGDTAKQPAGRVLPAEPFQTDRWKAIDADVKFTGKRIVKNADLPITDLYTHVVMQDGVLSLEPLDFGVAGGTLSSTIHLDGSAAPLKGRFTTSARHLKLKQLFPSVKTMQSALGEINGDAALSATGNSPAALAATSNGEVKAVVTQGTISRFLMEAAGLNVANVVYEKMFGTQDVKINCAAADFVATDGVLDSRVFALDTEDAVINIDGHVDLRDESMDLGIHPHTKGFRVFTLRSPLYVKGTFNDPHVGVDAGALALRAGAMVGLGLINPFAALIPLIAPSNNQPLPCSDLLSQMKQAPSAPPPGKKEASKPPLAGSGAHAGAAAAQGAPGVARKAPPAAGAEPLSPAEAAQYKGS